MPRKVPNPWGLRAYSLRDGWLPCVTDKDGGPVGGVGAAVGADRLSRAARGPRGVGSGAGSRSASIRGATFRVGTVRGLLQCPRGFQHRTTDAYVRSAGAAEH